MSNVRVAIAGIGNCASALVQGISYYRDRPIEKPGLMHPEIAGVEPGDIQIVAAFDVDRRKVGRQLEEAIFAAPNCSSVWHEQIAPTGVTVAMSPVLDGIAQHMSNFPEEEAFRVADATPVDVAEVLRCSGAEVLVSFVPVGADVAAKHFAEACLEAGVALVNCVPVFIASDTVWAARFRERGVPIIGDDIKSQVGATIVHRTLARLFVDRGVRISRTYQLNTGGNTDFLNMLAEDRLLSKRLSKTNSVQSQVDGQLPERNCHIGPSDYVAWQRDTKVAFIRLEAEGFGGTPLSLECRLSVEDSPNSAGVVIDAIRCAKGALDAGLCGPIEAASAYYMKSPPRQMRDSEAREACDSFIVEIAQNSRSGM